MNYPLHNYQKRMVDFALAHPYCALFAECGLGKSRTTLNVIARLINDCDIEKVLIVAPRKVADSTWTDEVSKWDELRHLRVSRVIGAEKKRIAALQRKADIYVIGRDSFVWLVKFYKAKMPFDMVVLDELTSFKSSTSLRFKAMRLVRSQFDRIIGLTGTPAPNGYLDLFGQMYCLDGGARLGKYKTKFIDKYFLYHMTPQHFAVHMRLRPGAKEEIEKAISDICISLRAEDYLTLPDITYISYKVVLSDALMRQYRKFEREQLLPYATEHCPTAIHVSCSSPLAGVALPTITASNAAALMGKLSQFCNGAVYDDEHLVREIHSEKLFALAEIVEAAQSPVLVFYQYKHDIPRIREVLKGYKVVNYEDGDTLNEWNAGKIDVLLAHPASTAYGLNMQEGGHIAVWFGTGFNSELYVQANARLHRQGQKHKVFIYQLYVPGTVDEKAIQVVAGKISVQEALMQSLKEIAQ